MTEESGAERSAMDEQPEGEAHGLDRLELAFERGTVYLALVTAWAAMLGSLYLSEVRHFEPCALCWYQRILMYPLALILAVGILRRDAKVYTYVLPLSLLGIVVSTYHLLIQKTDLFDHSIVCEAGIPCSAMYINWFGFVTIPVLALTAFVIVSLASSASRDGAWAAAGSGLGRPWGPVLLSIGGVIAFFALLRVVVG